MSIAGKRKGAAIGLNFTRSMLFILLAAGLAISFFFWRNSRPSRSDRDHNFTSSLPTTGGSSEAGTARSLKAEQLRGMVLAHAYCQACHLFPEPNLLDKRAWREGAFPAMKIHIGMTRIDLEKTPGGAILGAAGVFPPVPLIPETNWNAIVQYYLHTAPESPLPQDPKGEIQKFLKRFEVGTNATFRHSPPLTTLVKIDPAEQKIYFADATSQSLEVVDGQGNFVTSIQIGNIPVALAESERGYYFTCIGHFFPNDEPRGQLILLERIPRHRDLQRKVVLENLPRAVDAQFADLNGDGRPDFALCLFGNLVGRFSWFENLGQDRYEEHVLIDKPGAVKCWVHDFNGDGFPDLAVLIAQALETLFIFSNDGHGHFAKHIAFQKPPAWGHSYFELADFNQDGLMDLLVANGDNADFDYTPNKKYHGIRIYLNQGGYRFKESFFFPMNGAYKAMARDFDGDGDLDIAAISFFPDYEKAPLESFVYLENKGNLEFTASTFPESSSGRWLTMDVGDVDGDGDLDIVLGSLIKMSSPAPAGLMQAWEKNGPSILVLYNQWHSPGIKKP